MNDKKISVLLVDDSAVIRGLLTRILEEDPEIEIIGSRSNGEAAISAAQKYKPDIIVLDIEMPVMDGITALPGILKANPEGKILMCSTLSNKNADVSMKALDLGASECLLKPSTSRDIAEQTSFRRNLVNLVRTLSGHKPRDFDSEEPFGKIKPKDQDKKESDQLKTRSEIVKRPLPDIGEVKLRKLSRVNPTGYSALAIGSSTGGPQALFTVLKSCNNLGVPIFITQHMPPTFTKILAQHIKQNSGIDCLEAEDGMIVKNNQAYVAPGGIHMTVQKQENNLVIKLKDDPPENYCKPSVEPMMRSLTAIYGKKLLGVILTGMGHDGLDSCRKFAELDAPLIAQDKQTSVVWGMPGAVASAGLCTDVLPVDKIGDKINAYMGIKVTS